MSNLPPLSHALDEALSAVADAIEVYYRTTASDGTSSVEVREALSRAMKWVSTASRIDHECRAAERQPPHAARADDPVELGSEHAEWAPAGGNSLSHAG